ncbi:MAG: family 20 glycosylhydrolase [Saprospiraceae bacterium]|nr:family 20 glycosylhydrolase [Saprospiraceae bacterium]MCF8249462.1 family 20 glycosylhydrolase [Saprospiraceae bacterium]MCF8311591.1 family 20 glycosylhydrolase [Saprospiraceae bacterium]MCF8440081.1 family 20 glycosylhydrolase [Saprospiraceae bacterium]
MKKLTLPFFLLFFFACKNEAPAPKPAPTNGNDVTRYHIIPQPVSLTAKTGEFKITGDTKILLASPDEGLKTAAAHLASLLIKATGTTIAPAEGEDGKDAFLFQLDPSIPNDEGYSLTVTPYDVTIKAKTGAGAFYAVQTLRQLMPVEAENGVMSSLSIPCVEITDSPRYAYRGMHLDVGRHFFGINDVKKYIDVMALHKMNRFHWHLTEDQGWRLEIKKYPKLQTIAACRKETMVGHYNDNPQKYDGKEYCGFYTQDEAREIVRYAAERFITVIPEIEMPGHALAAIAAYPELGCSYQPAEVGTKWGVYDNVFCPKEVTFKFLEAVLTEVMDIFPSTYIHIGGDECPKTAWEKSKYCSDLIAEKKLKDEHGLQSYFIQRMEKFLNSKGRSIIGWDEILEGGLAPNATVMSWRGTDGGIAAAKQGHDVIMTPTDYCYLDYYQSQDPNEPLAIGGYLPLDKVYSYNPDPADLTPEQHKHILGVQANLWTEYIPDLAKLEYMAYPRACAIAEIAWSPQASRNYDDFVGRLSQHLKRLQALGVNAAVKIYDVKTSVKSGDGMGVELSLSPKMDGLDLRYTMDGTEPTAGSIAYTGPFHIDKSCEVKAQGFMDAKPVGNGTSIKFDLHKATSKVISLTEQPAEKYSGNGNGSVVNGVTGPNERYGGTEWLGFEGKDFEAMLHYGEPWEFSKVKLRFFNGKGQWVYPPKEVIISVSDDGKTFKEAGRANVPDGESKVIGVEVPLNIKKGVDMKVTVKRFGVIPAGQQGAGHEAWLFVDEVVVE